MNKKDKLAEEALKKEYEQLRKNSGVDEVNQNIRKEAYTSSLHPSARAQMVSNIQHQYLDHGANDNSTWGNVKDVSGQLKPEEALNIAIERVLSGGAPINNISFYDEINWHLSKLGFPSKAPLDIKQAILKMVEGK